MRILCLILQVCVALGGCSPVTGHGRVTFTTSAGQDTPSRCEANTAILDVLAQRTGADELIIVIARLGGGETRKNLSHRRLHNVRTYLTEYLTDPSVRRRPATVVIAEGERVTGHGRLEFYVGGKLAAALSLRRNADLILANCGSEPPENPCPPEQRNLYPCRDRR